MTADDFDAIYWNVLHPDPSVGASAAAFARGLSDAYGTASARREAAFEPLVPLLRKTRAAEHQLRWWWMDMAVRVWAPDAMDVAGLFASAAPLRALADICDEESAAVAARAVWRAATAAGDARDKKGARRAHHTAASARKAVRCAGVGPYAVDSAVAAGKTLAGRGLDDLDNVAAQFGAAINGFSNRRAA